MSPSNDILDAIRAMKDKLDAMRQERTEARRADARKEVGRERTPEVGRFMVRDSAPAGRELRFKPFSSTMETIYRSSKAKPTYRERATGRFTSRAEAARVRGTIAAQTAYNTISSRFPNLSNEQVRERVNELTELSIRSQLGEDVDIEIADIFGYPE